MRIAVVASRGFERRELLEGVLQSLQPERLLAESGSGVDRLVEDWARRNAVPFEALRPAWRKLGRAAGHACRRRLVGMAHLVLAFWDGNADTRRAVELAQRKGIPVTVVRL